MKDSLLYLSLLAVGALSKLDDSCSFRETRYKLSTGKCQANNDCLASGLKPVLNDSRGSVLCPDDNDSVSLECCVEVHSDVEKADLKARQLTYDTYDLSTIGNFGSFGSATLQLPADTPSFQLATQNSGSVDLSGANSVPLDLPSADPAPPPGSAEGTVSDLAYVQPVGTETASITSDENSNFQISQANEQLGPSLSIGTPVDHSNDDNIGLNLRPFSQQYGGRTGLLVGNDAVRVGVYKNPLIPQQPPMFGLEANFK